MASDITLYWASGSVPSWRAMICLEEKGLSGYNSKFLSFQKGEHKSEEVLKINPRGQVDLFFLVCFSKILMWRGQRSCLSYMIKKSRTKTLNGNWIVKKSENETERTRGVLLFKV